jgi:GNAT superfamily N-acetyltransferase
MNPEIVTLPDGDRMLIRPVESSDKELLRRGFEALSRETRYQRFFAPKERLTEAELRYYTEFDGIVHFAVAAGLTDDADEPVEGVGVARYVAGPEQPDVAEVAIVVADAYQRRGVGSRLLRHLIREAQNNGIRRFTASILRTNAAALQLIANVVGDCESEPDGPYRLVSFDI